MENIEEVLYKQVLKEMEKTYWLKHNIFHNELDGQELPPSITGLSDEMSALIKVISRCPNASLLCREVEIPEINCGGNNAKRK